MIFPQDLIIALVIFVGLIGTIIQILPGSLIVAGAIFVWALLTGGTTAWVICVLSFLVIAAGAVIKYVLAGSHMKRSRLRNSSIIVGLVAGAILFFVIPVIGLPIGFVLGVFLSEYLHTQDFTAAKASTIVALKATGITILVELGAALIATGLWIVGLVMT
ncbi:DUF456 domain-containing protein [Timonella sp. A28]|uniref:DUF456 domain-containing protein n=1 Tax=Timonella sp. A28 TaxID=3442640 RepID=UPI003EBB2F1E